MNSSEESIISACWRHTLHTYRGLQSIHGSPSLSPLAPHVFPYPSVGFPSATAPSETPPALAWCPPWAAVCLLPHGPSMDCREIPPTSAFAPCLLPRPGHLLGSSSHFFPHFSLPFCKGHQHH